VSALILIAHSNDQSPQTQASTAKSATTNSRSAYQTPTPVPEASISSLANEGANTVCSYALDSRLYTAKSVADVGWDPSPQNAEWVREAQRRGYTVSYCVMLRRPGLSPSSSQNDPSATKQDYPPYIIPTVPQRYRGNINGDIGYEITMRRTGRPEAADGSLEGTSFYTTYKNTIRLEGHVTSSYQFYLRGYYNGELIDDFRGAIGGDGSLSGTYTRMKDGEKMSFIFYRQ
jgi:hypothetical protein